MTDPTEVRAAIWARVSGDDQENANQLAALRTLARSRGLAVDTEYATAASAWKGQHRDALRQALDDAHRGRYRVLLIWALDRLSREGIEETFRTVRRFRESGVRIVSHEEPWLSGSPEVQDLMLAIASWMAEQESRRRSERIKAGLARRRADGLPVGRQAGAVDRKPRRRSGYVARWENERAAKEATR